MKNSIIYKRRNCRACESDKLDLFFSLKPSPIGDEFVSRDKLGIHQKKYPIDLYMCRDCNLFQLIDVISPEVLYGNYIYVSESSVGLKNHFNSFSKNIIQDLNLKKDSLVVDIGSNDGILLNFFKSSNMRVIGIEPAKDIAEIANKNGIKTFPDYLSKNTVDKILDEHGKAKVVTSNNVFANVDEIRNWVLCVKDLLDNDGVYIFESYYLLDVINNFVFDFIYHEHLSAFSVLPMKKLFESFDMELIRVQHINTKGGSLRYFVQKKSGTLKDDGSIKKYLEMENSQKLYEKSTFNEFSEKINLLKEQSLNYLLKMKSRGKKIAGFGASITGTTLIHHFQLEDFFDYLIDDNKAKHGMFSPGIHLPVYPMEEIKTLKPDIVYVLAWRFLDNFIERKNQIGWSGEIIRPVPNFEIL